MLNNVQLNLESIGLYLGSYNARDFFRHVRGRYLAKHNIGEYSIQNEMLDCLLTRIGAAFKEDPSELWASSKFQLSFRAMEANHLKILGLNETTWKEAEEAIKAGRVMSLLPYNAVMGDMTIRKYLPSRHEKFSGKWRHSIDPYGIFREKDRIEAVDMTGKRTYLATRKFPYAVLVNFTESCYIGCDGCYKGSMVRTTLSALSDIYPEYAEIKRQLTTQEDRAIEQARILTQWLNENPEVDTIVISGGEPTLLSNCSLEKISGHFKNAKYVKAVRMCTSSIFQGMWYRIDDDFVKILYDFKRETGRQFYINAHVTDEFQLSAPEAKIAVDKLQNAGIPIHLQMPLQEGINFRRDDLDWTIEKIGRISKEAYSLGVIPYKMIVDMHSPSHPDLTVPIETVTKVIRFLDEHLTSSDMERWQAYNVLHEQGNLYLYPYPHFTAVKEIDVENKRVTYFIPKIRSVHTYEEPLITGHNDNPNSLNPIADNEIKKKIETVRTAYHSLKKKIADLEAGSLTFEQKAKEIEIFERDFYGKSGILYPENKPLIFK